MPAHAINEVVPDHVPSRLVRPFDIYSAGAPGSDYFADLYQLKHDAPPVFWTPLNDGHWYVTDAALVKRVLTEPDSFSSQGLVVPNTTKSGEGFVPIFLDPPEHGKYRVHLSVALSRKGVAELSPGVRELAIDLIEGIKGRGRCEFMGDFAFKLPIIVFLRLVDLPENDRETLLDQVGKIIHPGSDKRAIIAGLAAYLAPIIRARRANPGGDLISWLSTREVDGERMSEAKLHSMCTLLLIGGLDSVANTLGFFARFLADNPGHRCQIIDNPSILPGAVEELLRRFPTVTAGAGRLCVADTQLGPAPIRAGEMVMCPPPMMNFDDDAYPDPLTVDFSRRISSVGTFGQGAHRCVGANLARAELTIFLEEWLRRIPEFEIADPDVQFKAGVNVSYERLELKWPVG